MSYRTRFSGQFNVHASTTIPIPVVTTYSVRLGPSSTPGVVAVIFPIGSDGVSEDEILSNIDFIIGAMRRFPFDVSFSGYLEANGEESGDLWRIYIKDGQAVRVDPEITWPKEEE